MSRSGVELRTVRLLVHPAMIPGHKAEWVLVVVATRGGVPVAKVLRNGQLEGLQYDCSESDIWAALKQIVSLHDPS